MLLETERLILRPIEETDVPALFPLINDADVARNLMRVPYPYPEEQYAPWIRKAREAMERKEQYDMAVVLKETGLPIGAIGFHDVVWSHMRAEMGYWFGKPYWGNGYATEAAMGMLQFGFDELGLERIHAYSFTRNKASANVLRKIGMTYEGSARHAFRKNGEFLDIFLFGIIREEFAARP